MIRKLLVVSLCLYLYADPSSAQESNRTTDAAILNQIDDYLIGLDHLLFTQEPVLIPSTQEPDTDSVSGFGLGKLVELQKKAYNAQTGLSLQLRYNNQMGLDVIDYSDEDNIYPYRNKGQISLNWDIMESSLIGRKANYKIFELNGMQYLYQFRQDEHHISRTKLLLRSERRWDLILSFIYGQRVALLNEILKFRENLYNSHRILYSDIAFIETEIHRVKSLIVIPDTSSVMYESEVKLIDIDAYLSNLSVDTMGLFDSYMGNDIGLKQYHIERQLLEMDKQSLSYVKQMKIEIFAKAQYFGVTGSQNSGKLDLGVSATFPLSNEHRKQKAVMSHQITMSRMEQRYAEESTTTQYNSQTAQFNSINNRLSHEILALKPIAKNIAHHRAMYQNNVSSLEALLFEYDAYLAMLANVYSTIREREMLIGGLIN